MKIRQAYSKHVADARHLWAEERKKMTEEERVNYTVNPPEYWIVAYLVKRIEQLEQKICATLTNGD